MFNIVISSGFIFFCFKEAMKLAQPILIALLLDYFQGRGVSTTMAYVYATIMSVLAIVQTVIHGIAGHLAWTCSMRTRAAAGSLLVRKVNFKLAFNSYSLTY